MASWYVKQDPEPYETIELVISGIIPLIYIVVGTLGNLLCVVILLRKQNRKTSTKCLFNISVYYGYTITLSMEFKIYSL